MPLFNEVKVSDTMFAAIALKEFVNKATGKTIKAGEKSGEYDTPGTIPNVSYDTSWIFEGNTAIASKIENDSAVFDKSNIRNSIISKNTSIKNSSAIDTEISFSNISFSIVRSCVTNACNVERSKVVGSNKDISFRVANIYDTVVNCFNSVFRSSTLSKCKIIGTQISISDSEINNFFIPSSTTIEKSTITPKGLSYKNDQIDCCMVLDVFARNKKLLIENADILSEHAIKIMKICGKDVLMFPSDTLLNNYISEDGKTGFINCDMAAVADIFCTENNAILKSLSNNMFSFNFISNELSLLFVLFPALFSGKNSYNDFLMLNKILERDLFALIASDSLFDKRMSLINMLRVDMSTRNYLAPNNLLLMSQWLHDFIEEICQDSAIEEKINASNSKIKVVWID